MQYDRKKVLEVVPELMLIQSDKLRDQCTDVWVEVLNESTWGKADRIDDCPFALGALTADCPEKVLEHSRRVVRLCYATADTLQDYFDKVGPCNKDYLVAAATIHDATKFWEYRLNEDGSIDHDPKYGVFYHHPISGAYLAKKHGIPDTVVYAVMAHSDYFSPGGAKAAHTAESYLMKALDDITFQYAKLYYGNKNFNA